VLRHRHIVLAGFMAAALPAFGGGGAIAASDELLSDSNAAAYNAGTALPALRTPMGVEVSLDGKGDGSGEKFLYLKGDYGAAPIHDDHGVLATPERAPGGALSGAEVTGLVGSFTPSHANLRFGFANRVGEPGKTRPGFDIALSSSLATNGADVFDPLGVDVSGVDMGGTAANLSLSLGYGGFNVDAGYLAGGRGLEYGYRGYDIGLGYQRGNWGTVLGFSGVAPTSASIGTDLMGTQSQYTMRLGAFYQIFPGFTLGGRFQFHDYTLFDSDESQARGEFFLNTKLHF